MLSSDLDVWTFAQEGTYGVDAVDALLAANDAIVYAAINGGSSITPSAINFVPDRARPSQDGIQSSFIKQGCNAALTIPMQAGFGTNNVPNYHAILEAAGFLQTASGGGSTTYNLQSIQQPSVTIWRWSPVLNTLNYRLRRATGVVGNLAISATVGQEPLIAFAGPGQGYFDLSAPAAWLNRATGNPILDLAGASSSTATMDSAEKLLCRSATITWGATTIPVSSLTIDNAMTPSAIETMNAHPTTARVVRGRAGVGAGTVALSFESTDGGAAFDALLAGGEANTVATLTMVFAGTTRKVTLVGNVQFLPVIGERDNGGTRGGDAQGILVANYAANPLGDNSLTATFANI